MDYLEFVETTAFSRARAELMTDDEFQEFQHYLLEHHDDGDTISHSGGCKKNSLESQRHGKTRRGQDYLLCTSIKRAGLLAAGLPKKCSK
jgi:hypothetical protein